MFPKDFLSSPVINEFVLSHVLMPLSQAGATMRQFDNPCILHPWINYYLFYELYNTLLYITI